MTIRSFARPNERCSKPIRRFRFAAERATAARTSGWSDPHAAPHAGSGRLDVIEALQFGARRVFMKQSGSEILFNSIRTVMAGQYWGDENA
jgi:hypothetical protein